MKDSQIEQLLNLAAAKLNMTPEQLKTAASSGDMNAVLGRLDKTSAEKVKRAMNNKQVTEELMKKFGGKL